MEQSSNVKETYFNGYITDDGDFLPIENLPITAEGKGVTKYSEQYSSEQALEARQEDYARWEEEMAEQDAMSLHPYVDLGARALHLTKALDSYNHASMLKGMLNKKDSKALAEYGGKDNIERAIAKMHANGLASLLAGSGYDLVDMSEQELQDVMNQMAYRFRTEYTADGVRAMNGSDVSAADKVAKARSIESNRNAFRRRLKKYQG